MSNSRKARNVLHTIGYEGLLLTEFIDVLHAHAVQVLVDVRDLPLSRKPGFSKKKLAAALSEEGIKYQHVRSLGAPKSVRHALRDTGDWQAYRSSYMQVLDDAGESLDEIGQLTTEQKVTLMCFERDFRICHRSLVAERMRELDLVGEVRHLHPQKEKVVVDVQAR